MSAAKHTPGPWELRRYSNGRWTIFANGESIMGDEEYQPWVPSNEADWRLIAAAPELLEALKRIMDADCPLTGNPSHQTLVEFWEEQNTKGRDEADDRLFALAAISKATGSQA